MVTAALIIFLIAIGFARSLRRRHVAQLTVEQKAAVMDCAAADAVWPIVAFAVVTVLPPRFAFVFLPLTHRMQGAMAVLAGVFLVFIAVSVTHQVRLRRQPLPDDYRRSSIIGAVLVHLALLLFVILLVRYAISYDAAEAADNA